MSLTVFSAILFGLSFFFWLDRFRLGLDIDRAEREIDAKDKEVLSSFDSERRASSEAWDRAQKRHEDSAALNDLIARRLELTKLYSEDIRKYVDLMLQVSEHAHDEDELDRVDSELTAVHRNRVEHLESIKDIGRELQLRLQARSYRYQDDLDEEPDSEPRSSELRSESGSEP
jgi:hypothetical protein